MQEIEAILCCLLGFLQKK